MYTAKLPSSARFCAKTDMQANMILPGTRLAGVYNRSSQAVLNFRGFTLGFSDVSGPLLQGSIEFEQS